MDISDNEKRIINFVNRSANSEELGDLEDQIGDLKNRSLLKEYAKTHFIVMLSEGNHDPGKIRSRLLKEIRKEKRRGQCPRILSILKYAAIVVAAAGATYFFHFRASGPGDSRTIVPRKDAITLQLEDGTIKIIDDGGTSRLIHKEDGGEVGRQEGNQIVYHERPSTKKMAHHTLTVPYGKRFDVVLSDGTRVFLNAGTSLKYPVQFVPGNDRSVFLTGEAFFDVTKDTGTPFVVNAEKLEVQVLGTVFSVANYKEDAHTDVVLVEGAVSIGQGRATGNGGRVVLAPGAKASFDRSAGTITTKKVNTAIYTAWINGDVVFRNAPFKNIVKRLERLYNVTIINNNKELDDEIFNASFEVDNESINDILRYFGSVFDMDYTTADNTIIIN